jgi:hypothetical protein
LNFNLENGKLLSIYDFVTKEKMIEFLNGEKFTVVENSHNHTLQFPINESYPRSSVISGDIEHNYDFYFTPNPLILKLLTLLQGVEHIGTIIAGIFIISAPPVLAGIFSGFTVFDIIRYRRFYKCVLLIPIYWMCWAWLYLITPVHELPPIWFNIFSAIYNIFEAHVATYLVGMWIWANAAFYVCVGPWIALIWTIVRFIKRRKNMRG